MTLSFFWLNVWAIMNARQNLTRVWRSTTFDEIVGQSLAVKLIKIVCIGVFFFPFNLLSGQRVCGKTTMGRLFASALNCAKLADFQTTPHEVVLPCRQCHSCQLMAKGAHPDLLNWMLHRILVLILFVFLSKMRVSAYRCRWKVYLIDEVHMLSKAAFNALLKVLEEPPVTALFMLATTDLHKVPDTIRSRCFQLFFDPIASSDLVKHLAHVCTQEKIILIKQACSLLSISLKDLLAMHLI